MCTKNRSGFQYNHYLETVLQIHQEELLSTHRPELCARKTVPVDWGNTSSNLLDLHFLLQKYILCLGSKTVLFSLKLASKACNLSITAKQEIIGKQYFIT